MSSSPTYSPPVRGIPVSQEMLPSTPQTTVGAAAAHRASAAECPPPPSPAPTESDIMSVTTMMSTIPPSYRTRRSEDHEHTHQWHQSIPPPPSAFMPMSGRRRDTLTSRPHGPRSALSHSRSRSRGRARGATSAHAPESEGGPDPRAPVREGRRPLRKSLDGGVRLAGGPLGTDAADGVLAFPPAYTVGGHDV